MFKNLLLAYSAGALGGVSNVLFLVIAAGVGLPALFGLTLPNFGTAAFFYKQVFWGGLWAFLFLTPLVPKNWVKRAVLMALLTAAATFFIFFPMGTVDGKGPGVAGLNIGTLMPVYVLLADLAYAFAASKVFQLISDNSETDQ